MTGPILIVLVVVIGLSILFMVSGALISVVLGHVLWPDIANGFLDDERLKLNT